MGRAEGAGLAGSRLSPVTKIATGAAVEECAVLR
jgi:hypothetical protein